MNRKRNVFDVLYIFVLLYAFSTITQSMYSISLNRIWTVGIIACILYSLLQSADKRTVLCLGIILTIGAWTTASSENIGRNSNDYIYFATAALASDCFAVCRKLHEQSSVGEYCGGIPDWDGNRDDCGQLYEGC